MKDRDTNQSYIVRDRETQVPSVPGSHVFTDIEKKSEKIVTAVYMVTDCIEKDDPIKDRIRDLSVNIMSEIHSMSLMSESESHTSLTRSSHFVQKLISFTELAVNVGYISDMNFMVLKKALNYLKDQLEKRQDAFVTGRVAGLVNRRNDVEKFQLPTNLFEDEEVVSLSEPKQEQPQKIQKKSEPVQVPKVDRQKSFKKPFNPKAKSTHPKRRDLNFKKQETVDSIKTYLEKKKSAPSPARKQNPRQERIVNLVRQKREVSVTDLKDNFENVSSKTIQRDLVALVTQGVLKREGDKRWARYSLKNTNP